MAARKQNTNLLPIFDGHAVETQRLKCSGSADKDQWVAVPHEGDTIVFTITKSKISDVGHKFTDDGVIRIENLHAIEVFADTNDKGRVATLFRDLASAEVEQRRKASGKVNLDDAMDEAATAAAATAAAATAAKGAAGDDEVGAARAARAKKPAAKKTTKK